MHSPFKKHLTKFWACGILYVEIILLFVIFDFFLKFILFCPIAQILVRNSLNVCYNLIAVIGEIGEGS